MGSGVEGGRALGGPPWLSQCVGASGAVGTAQPPSVGQTPVGKSSGSRKLFSLLARRLLAKERGRRTSMSWFRSVGGAGASLSGSTGRVQVPGPGQLQAPGIGGPHALLKWEPLPPNLGG